jgi:RHS repeat-associated protein
LQGAGGVGGVLAVQAGSSAQCGAMANTTHFACYDGNGNVTALMNAATGEESARYEYAPFAERLRETGPMAKLNPIRFSTQYADDVTGGTKYLFRDYQADTGRWPNRDPLNENSFFTYYTNGKSGSELRRMKAEMLEPPCVFVGNNSLNIADFFGLWRSLPREDLPPGAIKSGDSFVTCQGGKAVPYVSPFSKEGNSGCVNKCVLLHEQSHADDANAANACVNAPDGYIVIASGPPQRRESEIKAYTKQLECLKRAEKVAAGQSDDYKINCVCRPNNVRTTIQKVQERLDKWNEADPNGPFPE